MSARNVAWSRLVFDELLAGQLRLRCCAPCAAPERREAPVTETAGKVIAALPTR